MKTFKHVTGLVAIFATILLAGCPGSNPVKPAIQSGSPELVAFALEGSFTIVQGKARAIVEDPSTPPQVKQAIASIVVRVNPILDAARPLAVEAENLKRQLAAGNTTGQERLAVLLPQIDALVTKVSPLITDLVNAIANAGG